MFRAQLVYDAARKWFTVFQAIGFVAQFKINAPFGKFTLSSQNSVFLVDGIKSWIVMELVSPLCFMYTFIKSPLSPSGSSPVNLTSPPILLASLYLLHYLNRAILSPLRTPSRSKSHIIVPFFAVCFNSVNGSLMGTYLSSPPARAFLAPSFTYGNPVFYLGLVLWALGFAGNIAHDEILLDIRRKAKVKGKGKEDPDDGSQKTQGEHYSIPHGLLYEYISYPNYLCEWIEWAGFALAASPIPFSKSPFSLPQFSLVSTILAPDFAPLLTPPWIFVLGEIFVMLPRAFKGHLWYKSKFGDSYPKKRKAVIPFLF